MGKHTFPSRGGTRAHHFLAAVVSLFLSLQVTPAGATDVWAVTSGVPCCEIPDPLFKYLDADSACQMEVPLPTDTQCTVNHRDMRNAGGPQHNGGGCIYDVDCVCGDCMLASGPHTMTSGTGRFAWKKPRTCPAGTTLQLEQRAKPADLAERLAIEQALESRGYLRRQIGGWC